MSLSGTQAGPRRDAARTRAALLAAARRRFGEDGYAATTVREIADDAGVNVALINRYYGSKAGLFEACITDAAEEFGSAVDDVGGLTDAADAFARLVTAGGQPPNSQPALLLLLLLRPAGDDHAEEIRRNFIRTAAERLAAGAGWRSDDPATAGTLLRAQMVFSTVFGLAVLRSSPQLEPLSSAGEDALAVPLRELIQTLLGQP